MLTRFSVLWKKVIWYLTTCCGSKEKVSESKLHHSQFVFKASNCWFGSNVWNYFTYNCLFSVDVIIIIIELCIILCWFVALIVHSRPQRHMKILLSLTHIVLGDQGETMCSVRHVSLITLCQSAKLSGSLPLSLPLTHTFFVLLGFISKVESVL